MRHYSELELLDQVYLSGEPEMSRHLEACASCRSTLERLRAELGSIRDEFDHRVDRKPDAFWDQQRAAILARTRRRPERATVTPFRAWALAASLVIAVGGGWMIRERLQQPPAPPMTPVTATSGTTAALAEPASVQLPTADPWASEELAAWESAVDWESWLEPGDPGKGGA